ncbi:hypothetical protein DUNSADRAFT_17092 [Dunaliella salina]|uniref:Encoded protein n=1 Tax=Dunaliella salina TaxID=3046 RepID=A0ABQ7G2F5_DUNSA|nr:hypothetical protein DUNSADRAFT_17092 [Dunaliella salina]|eukprot:KAF5828775.1 hypothetical protein DUNSADRAFT_17092 [Dunaliella salina]
MRKSKGCWEGTAPYHLLATPYFPIAAFPKEGHHSLSFRNPCASAVQAGSLRLVCVAIGSCARCRCVLSTGHVRCANRGDSGASLLHALRHNEWYLASMHTYQRLLCNSSFRNSSVCGFV